MERLCKHLFLAHTCHATHSKTFCPTSKSVDNNDQVPRNHPNHDPLFKVRPMIDMMERKFRNCHRSGKDLSVDEACCLFKGRFSFKCYNPSKPKKWHIKLFEISDAKTGYCLGFEVYAGKGKTTCANTANVLDPGCTETTKVIMGLMEICHLLDKGHHVYMDKYYSSPELFEELHYRNTYACGTCHSNRKNMSKAVINAKLKKGEAVFRRAGPLLCFKWNEKRDVRMLSTTHEACIFAALTPSSSVSVKGTGDRTWVNKLQQFFHTLSVSQDFSLFLDLTYSLNVLSITCILCKTVTSASRTLEIT